MTPKFTKLLLLSAIASTMFFSCTKNDQSKLPVTLTLKSVTPMADFRVFAQSGEVTDPVMKESPVRASQLYGLNYSFGPVVNSGSFITFVNPTILMYGKHDAYTYIKTADGYFFEEVSYGDNNAFSPGEAFVTQFLKYPEMRQNANGSYSYQKRFAGYGNMSELTIRGFSMFIRKRDVATGAVIYNSSWAGQFNEFNPEGVKALAPQDTMVIREINWNFSRN